jgi:hypothetical protein
LQITTERREQDLGVGDTIQQDLVLAADIEQMSELMLRPSFTINDTTVANICRAKTLIAISQIDSKRKTHLFKFLYEARMIRHNQPHIDLADAVLHNIDLSGKYARIGGALLKVFYIDGGYGTYLSEVFFKRVSLNNASFANLNINYSNFQEASLIGANFIGTSLSDVNLFVPHYKTPVFVMQKVLDKLISSRPIYSARIYPISYCLMRFQLKMLFYRTGYVVFSQIC